MPIEWVFVAESGADQPDMTSNRGTAPTFTSAGTTSSTTSTTPESRTVTNSPGATPASDTDPELAWLSSPEAQRYAGHWVALRAGTSEFLGLADEAGDVQRWQAQGASILYVEPPGLWIGG
jgi:hypothetical protein